MNLGARREAVGLVSPTLNKFRELKKSRRRGVG
jgi:hypothetical protein